MRRRLVLGGVWVLALLAGAQATASAQDGERAEGPSVSVDRPSVLPGERVVVTLSGWSGRVVTLSMCGNLARRGSADCNMIASQGVPLDRGGRVTVAEMTVVAPSVSCPCLVRASSPTNDQLAVAPIELVGVPIAPVVGDGAADALEVHLVAAVVEGGLIERVRAALGGPTRFDVTVTVRNRSTETIPLVTLGGTMSRGGSDVGSLDLAPVRDLAPAQVWEHTLQADVPAPALGELAYSVSANGAGTTAQAAWRARRAPLLLLLLVSIVVVDVAVMVVRGLRRRRSKARGAESLPPVVAHTPREVQVSAIPPL
ncbi:MAG: hypothetical protein ACRDYW_08575 [Acidimicrobiales bacterium]